MAQVKTCPQLRVVTGQAEPEQGASPGEAVYLDWGWHLQAGSRPA